MELAQLSGIFEDKSIQELQIILLRHGNNVDAAVESILNNDDEVVQNDDKMKTTMTARPPSYPSAGATIVSLPSPHDETASEEELRQRRTTLQQQEAQEQQEEAADLAKALEASKEPSDRGRLGLFSEQVIGSDNNDTTIDELMRDPSFVQAIMEDDDLCAAIRLQKRLDEEEAAAAAQGGGTTISPGSLASDLQRKHHQSSLSPSSIKRILWDTSTQRLAVSEVKTRLQSLIKRAQQDKQKQNHQPPSDTDAQLVEQLEALNRDNAEEQFKRHVKRQAEAACLDAIHVHLDTYLQQHLHDDDASYEGWIEELHPENAHDGLLLQEMGKTIDHRFYVESSDHRKIWNERIQQQKQQGNSRALVPVRVGVVSNKNHTVKDLLSDDGHDNSAPTLLMSTPTIRSKDDDLLFGNYPPTTTTTPVDAALDDSPTQFDPFGSLHQSNNNDNNNVDQQQQQSPAIRQQQSSTTDDTTTTTPVPRRDDMEEDGDDLFGEFQNAIVPGASPPSLFLSASTSCKDNDSSSTSQSTKGPDKDLIVFD